MKAREVLASISLAAPDQCAEWPLARDPNGYGRVWFQGRMRLAHRVAWFLAYQEWPTEALDHLCYNTACVNLKHLEPVTFSVNSQRAAAHYRKDCCPRGHAYEGNFYLNVRKDGPPFRVCKICRRQATAEYKKRKRLKEALGL